MGQDENEKKPAQTLLPPPPTSKPRSVFFSEEDKVLLQSSFEEFRDHLKIVGLKHSEKLPVFGHEDLETIFATSAGPFRNTEEARAEGEDGYLPPALFQGKDVLLSNGTGNLPFSLVKWGARSVAVAETDPVLRAWQRAKAFYGSDPSVRPIFRTRSIPFKDKSEYLDCLRPILERVLDEAPPEPFPGCESIQFLDCDPFGPEEPEGCYDFLVVPDLFGVPGGLSTEDEFEPAFRDLLRYRNESGSVFLFPADYAEDLTNYSGVSFLSWLQNQNLAAQGLELVPPEQYHKVVLARITFLPNVLKGRFLLLRPKRDQK